MFLRMAIWLMIYSISSRLRLNVYILSCHLFFKVKKKKKIEIKEIHPSKAGSRDFGA